MKTVESAVVAFSGGLDSTTVLYEAIERYGTQNVYPVAFHYGQKHSIELVQAAVICNQIPLKLKVVDLPQIFGGAGSTLIDSGENVQIMGSYDELHKKHGSQPTVVPNRNMNFIAMCITVALTRGVNRVMLGVHGTDSAEFHYPDCTPMFIGAMNAAAWIGNEYQVQIEAPYNTWSKGQVVKRAAELKVPVWLTQSCYAGERPQCGKCATCHERQEAFKEAEYIDPTDYVVSQPINADHDWWPVKRSLSASDSNAALTQMRLDLGDLE